MELVKPPIPASAEIDRLMERLQSMAVEQIVPYDEILVLIGEDKKKSRWRSIVQRAIRRLLNEHGIVFTAVRGIGLQRLASNGIVKQSGKSIPAIRRKVRRTRRMLDCANIEELNREDHTTYILTASMLAVIAPLTAPRFLGQLTMRAADTTQEIRPGRVLELFLQTGKN